MSLEQLLYGVQHQLGIQPKWEKELIKRDYQLKTYWEWKRKNLCCVKKCDSLYQNRLNYLKGWLK
jgi:hypothetical protein